MCTHIQVRYKLTLIGVKVENEKKRRKLKCNRGNIRTERRKMIEIYG